MMSKIHYIMLWPLRIAILIFLTYSALLITHPTYAQPSSGETVTIQIVGPAQAPGFSPAIVTVHVFDYVVFSNQALPIASFSLASDDGTLSSPSIASGKQWTTTFTHAGTFEYHDTANPPHMVGEIVVVADSVSLLPTPAPGLQATALALAQAGKAPPDNLSLITPTPTATPLRLRSSKAVSPLANPWLLTLLLMVESVLLLITFSVGFLFFRSYRHRLRRLANAAASDTNTSVPEKVAVKQGLFRRWRHKNDDEDEGEEYYDEEL